MVGVVCIKGEKMKCPCVYGTNEEVCMLSRDRGSALVVAIVADSIRS